MKEELRLLLPFQATLCNVEQLDEEAARQNQICLRRQD
jgi:hypothetical protein